MIAQTVTTALLGRTAIEVCGGSALFFTLLLLLGLWRLRCQPRAPSPPEWPALALLRPCEGSEPGLLENLRRSVTAAYPGPRRVLLLLPSRGDPAYAVAATVAAEVPADPRCTVEVVVTSPRREDNRKVAQLAAGLRACREPVIVTIDSDVRLEDGDLPALIAALLAPSGGPRTAAAFASPVEIAPRTPWDRASAALVGGSPQNFMALYGLTRLLGGVTAMAGALCALHREPLLEVGGFDGVRRYLGEDYELSRRLRARGYSVALSPEPARCTDGGRGARAVLLRVVRWMTVVRAQRPLLLITYPLFVAATPLLLLAALIHRTPLLSLFALLLLATRALLCDGLRRAHGLRRPPGRALLHALVEVLAAEALLLFAFVGACLTRSVRWRGHRFRVGRGGELRAEGPSPQISHAAAEVESGSARPEQRGPERDGLLGSDPGERPLDQHLPEQPPDERQLRAPP
jgi:ceramide glucosyltransferase